MQPVLVHLHDDGSAELSDDKPEELKDIIKQRIYTREEKEESFFFRTVSQIICRVHNDKELRVKAN